MSNSYMSIVFWFRYHIAGLESVDHPNAKRVKLNSLDDYPIAGKMVTNIVLNVYLTYKLYLSILFMCVTF